MPILKTIKGRQQRPQQYRKKTDPFYYSTPWRKLRARKLKQDPLCQVAEKQGRLVPAEMVDHHKPRSLWPELELDINNLVSMSHHYHNKKRQIEKNIKTKEDWHRVFDNHKLFNTNGNYNQ